jgi:hypothetical protein
MRADLPQVAAGGTALDMRAGGAIGYRHELRRGRQRQVNSARLKTGTEVKLAEGGC